MSLVNEQPFMFLLTFNVIERAAKLQQCTDGIISLAVVHSKQHLVIKAANGGDHIKLLSAGIDEHGRPFSRDASLYSTPDRVQTSTFSSHLKDAHIVGIVADGIGRPKLTFMAKRQAAGWYVEGKILHYSLDKLIAPTV